MERRHLGQETKHVCEIQVQVRRPLQVARMLVKFNYGSTIHRASRGMNLS